MTFWPFGFTGAKGYDRRVYDEQVLLERWRKEMTVSDLAESGLTDAEWAIMRRELTLRRAGGTRHEGAP